MGNKSEDVELVHSGNSAYKDEDEEQTLRPSLEDAYASSSNSSDHSDVDEFDDECGYADEPVVSVYDVHTPDED